MRSDVPARNIPDEEVGIHDGLWAFPPKCREITDRGKKNVSVILECQRHEALRANEEETVCSQLHRMCELRSG